MEKAGGFQIRTGFRFHQEVSFNQVPNVNITNINQIMEVKLSPLRSVTLGQAGRFHITWTHWNLPGGPRCLTMKPDSAPAPGAAGRSAGLCERGGGVSALRPGLGNRVLRVHRELRFVCGCESKRTFGAQGVVSSCGTCHRQRFPGGMEGG